MLNAIRQRFRDVNTLKTLFLNAERHANSQGQREPGAEHLVLAALELPDCTATQAFARLGITADSFRNAVEGQYRSALANLGIAADDIAGFEEDGVGIASPRGPYRSHPSAQRLMSVLTRQIMKSEQKSDPTAALRGAHILLAASAAKRGVCPRTFESMGITPEQLSAAARQALQQTRQPA